MNRATDATASALVPLDATAQRLLFTEARTANRFDPEPVSDATLRAIWELSRWPPTSANCNPLRILFVRGEAAKGQLIPHMNEGNRAKTESAPVVAVLAADMAFHEYMPRLVPYRTGVKESLAEDDARRESLARFNAILQIGYFLLAVRAVGLVAGPMGGFDQAGVDTEFFTDSTWRSLLVVNIGKPAADAWFDRLPRLDYDEVVRFA
jgi:3-hydroxypropanoate dehydrogenase